MNSKNIKSDLMLTKEFYTTMIKT